MRTTLLPTFCGSRKARGDRSVAGENLKTSQIAQRDETVDIIKGILIILVVVGHYQTPIKDYIYWFHMPCFFMVSGFFLKDCKSMEEVKIFAVSKCKRLMIPYISYLTVFATIMFTLGPMVFDLESVVRLIYGGKLLVGGLYNIFWFVTVLCASLIVLSFLTYQIKSSNCLVMLMIAMYSLAHLEGVFSPLAGLYYGLPLGVDTCLLAIPYVWVGKILYQKRNYLRKEYILLASIGFAFLVLSNCIGFESYILDMKPGKYTYWIYDTIVPIMCMILLYAVSNALVGKRIAPLFLLVGRSSITIMFLHMTVIMVCRKILPSPWHFLVGISLGIMILVIVHGILKKYNIFRYLFIGESKYINWEN